MKLILYNISQHGIVRKTATQLPVLLIILFCRAFPAKSQERPMSLDDCIKLAIHNNLQVKTASLEVQRSRTLEGTSFDLPKTNISLSQDPTSGGNMDNSIGISQTFSLPSVYKFQKKALEQQTLLSEGSKLVTQAEVIFNVRQAYNNLQYANEKLLILNSLDSIYREFSRKAEIRLKIGETSNLERLTAQNKFQEIQITKKEALADIEISQYRLLQLMAYDRPITIADNELKPLALIQDLTDTSFNKNPIIGYFGQNKNLFAAREKVEKSKLLPEITLGYSHQLLIRAFNPAKINRDYFGGTRIAGLQLGVNIPIFASSYHARIKAEKINESIALSKLAETRLNLQTEWRQGFQRYLKFKDSFDYYKTSGSQLAQEQIRVALFAFGKGEIGYIEFIQNISVAIQSELNYLSTVYSLNEAVISLQYLQGEEYLK